MEQFCGGSGDDNSDMRGAQGRFKKSGIGQEMAARIMVSAAATEDERNSQLTR